ncbi:unknown [Clostridium sp. CAG:149]|nr:unknown [Clostridium sp. CAG:149]
MCYNSRRAVKSLQGRELQAQGTGQHKMRRFIL